MEVKRCARGALRQSAVSGTAVRGATQGDAKSAENTTTFPLRGEKLTPYSGHRPAQR